ncbi:hypothetical protein IQ265_15175 [Nodosilinea sp. LEGE 06152]|uniref:hypothetical protein n=1 Tax=Nodosilinea sp. LEGE 06152 TaxID=2777966 RepID=UPI00187F3CAC|nr:hypothetical protein [Nodosilinea sp. LEGE 06152]MBE9158159.1 hypothetical protein [Nodosilinea sp. LEGE 06152]
MGRLTQRLGLLFLAILALVISFGLSQSGSTLDSRALAQGNAPPPALAPALPMVSGSFEDPQGRFQIGILDGYSVSTVGATPLFQAADGSLAYTVAVAPLLANSSPEAAMVAAAESTFGAGEGFVAGDVQPIAGGGVRVNWSGRLSQGAAPPQPITGKIFARQRDAQVFLLMVAATSAGEAQVADAINALGSTLTVP